MLEMSQKNTPQISAHIEPDMHVLGARVSTKGSNAEVAVNPYGPDHVANVIPRIGLYVQCEDATELVGLGKIYEGGPTIHNVTYADDVVRVSVDKVINGDAKVLWPSLEIKYVKQALGTFIAWPRSLVKVVSNEVFYF